MTDTFNVDFRFTGRALISLPGQKDDSLADVIAQGKRLFCEKYAELYPFMPEVIGVQRIRDSEVIEQLEGEEIPVDQRTV